MMAAVTAASFLGNSGSSTAPKPGGLFASLGRGSAGVEEGFSSGSATSSAASHIYNMPSSTPEGVQASSSFRPSSSGSGSDRSRGLDSSRGPLLSQAMLSTEQPTAPGPSPATRPMLASLGRASLPRRHAPIEDAPTSQASHSMSALQQAMAGQPQAGQSGSSSSRQSQFLQRQKSRQTSAQGL
jgi:hypothetical protein